MSYDDHTDDVRKIKTADWFVATADRPDTMCFDGEVTSGSVGRVFSGPTSSGQLMVCGFRWMVSTDVRDMLRSGNWDRVSPDDAKSMQIAEIERYEMANPVRVQATVLVPSVSLGASREGARQLQGQTGWWRVVDEDNRSIVPSGMIKMVQI